MALFSSSDVSSASLSGDNSSKAELPLLTFFTFDNMTSLIEFSKYADLSKVKIAIRLSTMEVFTDKFIHLGAPLKESLDMLIFLKKVRKSEFKSYRYANQLNKKAVSTLNEYGISEDELILD